MIGVLQQQLEMIERLQNENRLLKEMVQTKERSNRTLRNRSEVLEKKLLASYQENRRLAECTRERVNTIALRRAQSIVTNGGALLSVELIAERYPALFEELKVHAAKSMLAASEVMLEGGR